MKKNNFNHFQNKECIYFPCHDTVPREDFNCLFCYCPLYFIDEDCGGKYNITETGFKDCKGCTRNHDKDSWKFIVSRLREYMNVETKFSRIDTIGLNGNDGDHYD